jgi:hypothetical protein
MKTQQSKKGTILGEGWTFAKGNLGWAPRGISLCILGGNTKHQDEKYGLNPFQLVI